MPVSAAPAVVVVGASWGGLNALSTLIASLPPDFALPVAIVQHRSKQSDRLLAELLQDHTALRVCEADDKEPICAGHVYVAPPDYHLLLDGPHFSLTVDPPVRYSRPSIDVTFLSAADAFGAGTIGVVLTGANEDGAAGLRYVADRGGRAIVQDPKTAEVATMPAAALKAVPGAEVLTVQMIGARLGVLARGGVAESTHRTAGWHEAKGTLPAAPPVGEKHSIADSMRRDPRAR